MTVCSIIIWLENIADLKELLLDRAQEVEARLDLSLRVVSLHSGGDHRNEPALGGHLNMTKVRDFFSESRGFVLIPGGCRTP